MVILFIVFQHFVFACVLYYIPKIFSPFFIDRSVDDCFIIFALLPLVLKVSFVSQ